MSLNRGQKSNGSSGINDVPNAASLSLKRVSSASTRMTIAMHEDVQMPTERRHRADAQLRRPASGSFLAEVCMKSAATQTTEGIPASDFVQLVARIAQVAAAWAADTMALPEDLSKPMDADSVERFAEDILTRVYRIRERAYMQTVKPETTVPTVDEIQPADDGSGFPYAPNPPATTGEDLAAQEAEEAWVEKMYEGIDDGHPLSRQCSCDDCVNFYSEIF